MEPGCLWSWTPTLRTVRVTCDSLAVFEFYANGNLAVFMFYSRDNLAVLLFHACGSLDLYAVC